MEKATAQFEKYISSSLIIVAMLYVIYQTLDLFWIFGYRVVNSIMDGQFEIAEEGHPVLGLFFNILITLEVIQTIRVFMHDQAIKIKMILIVGLIASTRKILLMDMVHVDPKETVANAILIIALAAGYFLFAKSVNKEKEI
jgi:uncharacterized membrane protein (DUF373 family)